MGTRPSSFTYLVVVGVTLGAHHLFVLSMLSLCERSVSEAYQVKGTTPLKAATTSWALGLSSFRTVVRGSIVSSMRLTLFFFHTEDWPFFLFLDLSGASTKILFFLFTRKCKSVSEAHKRSLYKKIGFRVITWDEEGRHSIIEIPTDCNFSYVVSFEM